MVAPRPGTEKRAVYDAFQEGGAEAAVKAAVSANTRTHVRKWIALWGGDTSVKVKADVRPVRQPRGLALNGKRHVHYKGHADQVGIVTSEGTDQCMVFWPHLGCEKAEISRVLITVKESK